MAEQTAACIVLVIEDEESVREVIQRSLERAGYHVLSASDGSTGVALFREHPETAGAVVDLILPGIDGLETIARLRALRGGLPVVLSSGYGRPELDTVRDASRPTAFLAKPFEPPELVAAVRSAIG